MRNIIKKSLSVAAVMLVTLSGVCSAKTDKDNINRYAHENSELIQQPDSMRKVVFLGNSITQFWRSKHPEFFTSNGFVGRGISGQTSYQILLRLRSDVLELHPEAVVINIAINDIAENTHPYSEDNTMRNIMNMVELSRLHGIKVILTSLLPAKEIYWDRTIENVPQKVAALNSRIRKYAAENGIPFVDYHPLLAGDDGESLDPAYTEDGVHPTPAGYDVMEAAILPVVRNVCSTVGDKGKQ